jgi:(p)ppGpp synthase/HD superfamily hydrolase
MWNGSEVERSLTWAAERHRRAGHSYGGADFSVHLKAVSDVLVEFRHTQPIPLTIAHLHDVLEDTPTTREDVEMEFGLAIADAVWALTDEPGANRHERQRLTYVKLREALRPYPYLLNVKLADRLANVRASLSDTRQDYFRMYQTEHPFFCREFGRCGGDPAMWSALDRILQKNPAHKVTKALLAEWSDVRERVPAVHAVVVTLLPRLSNRIEDLRHVVSKA